MSVLNLKKEIKLFENYDIKLFWEFINLKNFEEWKKNYEKNKRIHLINLLSKYNSYIKLLKLFEWDIRVIKFLINLYSNGYFYFLKVELKESKEQFYLGFVVFLDNFYPNKCNLVKCNNLVIKSNQKLPFVWYIYAHKNYKELMQEFFKKNIKYIDLCDHLIFNITQSNVYWLKSDNEILLEKVYNYKNDFFPLSCEGKKLTILRKNSMLYRCKIRK